MKLLLHAWIRGCPFFVASSFVKREAQDGMSESVLTHARDEIRFTRNAFSARSRRTRMNKAGYALLSTNHSNGVGKNHPMGDGLRSLPSIELRHRE